VAGTLASLAWIVARPRDRWHALAVGALVLLAWMPRSALEPGFQLSFAAVAAIFLVLPRLSGVPDAYPVPRGFWDVLVVAVACGLVTRRSCGSTSDGSPSGRCPRTSPPSRRCPR
jgi:competence protein ComEC